MPYSSLPFPGNTSLENLKVIAEDTVLYVGITGSDGTGTGTREKPYATLTKAMDVAREYIIAGRAILTVRLLRGEYTLTKNLDLYHPQGGNLIIEGDPEEFKQRTLYSVDSYTWNLGQFAGGGHTGEIRVFDGVTTDGVTHHGFTAIDQGTYFTIVNAAHGARSNYYTNGASGDVINGVPTYGMYGPISVTNGSVSSISSSYNRYYYGDHAFNHGFSYEDGDGILGIGRILGATSDSTKIRVQFQNINYDGRCPAWHENGGLNNTLSWCDVANNYPETQYSQPTGYYGSSSWKNESGSRSYPSIGASQVYITPDPLVMSTYPVVVRCSYGTNSGTLYLKDGKLRAIRNIMFANNDRPFTMMNGVTGATLNYSHSLSVITDQAQRHSQHGVGLHLENSEIGIRHLGFMGAGLAIAAYGSKINKYSSTTIDLDSKAAIQPSQYQYTSRMAVLNSLDNAPVLCTAHCSVGIRAKDSEINLRDGSGVSNEYSSDFQDSSVYLGVGRLGIDLYGSKLKTTSVYISNSASIPMWYCQIAVPVFPDTNTAGASASFLAYSGLTAQWDKYPLMVVSINEPNSATARELAFGNYYATSTSALTNLSGSTSGASYNGSIQPTDYRLVTVFGVKIAPAGISYITEGDVRNGITSTSSSQGGTLNIRFFNNTAGTSLAASYQLGRTSVLVQGANGFTFGITGMPTASSGNSAAQFLQSWISWGKQSAWMTGYVEESNGGGINVNDASELFVEKVAFLENCPGTALRVHRGSKAQFGDMHTLQNPSGDTQRNGTVNSIDGGSFYNYTQGFLCIRGGWYNALYAWDRSDIRVGTLYTKHPSYIWTGSGNENAPGWGTVVNSGSASTVNIGSYFVLALPALTSVLGAAGAVASAGNCAWNSRTNGFYGFRVQPGARYNNPIFRADNGSTIVFEPSVGEKVVHFDAGTPNVTGSGLNRNFAVMVAQAGSVIVANGTNTQNDTSAQGVVLARFTTDLRTTTDRKLATRSTGSITSVYNTNAANRVYTATANPSTPNTLTTTTGVHYQNVPNAGTWSYTETGAATGITQTSAYGGWGLITHYSQTI